MCIPAQRRGKKRTWIDRMDRIKARRVNGDVDVRSRVWSMLSR
jgi:hypothetical protein